MGRVSFYIMNNIPEEIETMAFLIGQSNQIDSMIIEKPSTLITSTQTLKKGLNDYVHQQRTQNFQQPPPQPQAVPIPPYVPPVDIPQYDNNTFQKISEPKSDDGQLELNLEPTKADEIIILLKEISSKLTKQNNMLEKYLKKQDDGKFKPIHITNNI